MKNNLFALVFISLIVMAAILLLHPYLSHAADPQEIRIGVTGPLTGPAAESGTALKLGMILAMEEWNAAGGIYVKEYGKKVPIKSLIEDCQSKPEVGVSVGEKLIVRDKVHLLIGDAFHSSVTMAVMELAPKYGIPVMSGEPVSKEIEKKVISDPKRYWSYWKQGTNSDNTALSIFSTVKQLLDKGLLKPKNKTIAIVVEDTDWGRSIAEKTVEYFAGMGWKILTTETVPLGYTDFYPQLTKIKSMNPDVLIPMFTPLSSGVAITKQFQEVGMKCLLFGIYYPVRPEFITQVGKDADYLVWNPLMIETVHVPHHKEFAEKMKKRWNVAVYYDHGAGYDYMNNALWAIQKAGSLDPKAIVQAVSKLDRKGVLGRFVFDQQTHASKGGENYIPIPAAQIINGKNVVLWPTSLAFGTYQKQPWIE